MKNAHLARVAFELNGQLTTGHTEARTSLADYVRDQHGLTGTNLGCEQGVCGACTISVDDMPIRSCIVRAITCAGSRVRTIESFDDDAVMIELRAAFSQEHALQCGYCTPGMLITARDIVLRLPQACDEQIRLELSGNLCRCTGYVGIVNAIRRVLNARKSEHPPVVHMP
jgi:carbon-monoxide dehydrogenase small subunit